MLLLSACAGQGSPGGPVLTPAASGQVTAIATVLQQGDGAPELCLGGVAESYPPQCSGPEIAGWDWDAVEAESAHGTTWGTYEVKGSWDGATFRLAEAAAARAERPESPDDRYGADTVAVQSALRDIG